MDVLTVVMSTADLHLAHLQEVKRRRRRSHVRNRRARGYKSPSERARSIARLFQMLPFHGVDPVDWFPDVVRSPSVTSLVSYESFDDTDWFAGNEWAEGSF
ncbi:RNA silencing suppressor [Cucumber mosaic virus]|uniref:RNA silencing suppressor n=1 Tax=Cucumber mosaic virus TaxID=12305 RepID=A0A1L3KKB9_9BROM|nr:RNA silencing suppressor [Cucumber mosaic virus]UKM63443.1 MAG: 2b protein [Cucumber mosaic virus]UKM63445.1 MAG: 2b protein [Cucumber mosaic virus]UKM63447.1 MAG: 2b protein [Cucumber mosaic virus]